MLLIYIAFALVLMAAAYFGLRTRALSRETRALQGRLDDYLASDPVRQLGHALNEVEEQRARGDRMLGFVQDIEKERDRWRNLHEAEARGAGAAQALLMHELDRIFKKAARLATELRKLGRTVPPLAVRPELRPILEEQGLSAVEPPPEPPPPAPPS